MRKTCHLAMGMVLWLFGFLGIWGSGALVLVGQKNWLSLMGLLWGLATVPALYYGWRFIADALGELHTDTTSTNVQVWKRD